ncbi:hypothetical protein SLS53_009352 [Cytospora paraplurivora]|uniref:Rhodopsin domain-containing protein n=1 Tax=Cytospora paraplurivora TaxID=2898453 RepID=A0AAN9TVX6_9PEZI
MAHTDQARQDSLVIVSTVLTSISSKGAPAFLTRSGGNRYYIALVVIARSILRFFVIMRASYDDYTILVAQIFNIGCMVEVLVARANHIGFPAATLTINNMLSLLKVALALEVTYHIIVGFVKISILCLYLRFAIAGINIITDIWIIILPIKTLKGINRPLKEKIALVLIFGAGVFATVMSIVRLQSVYTYTLATDKFRNAIAV